MGLIEAELGAALGGGRVQRKANTTRKLRVDVRAKAKRVTSGAPEVVVKITGFGKGAGHLGAHLAYISRNGEVELETDRGDLLTDKAAVTALFDGWRAEMGDGKRRQNQRDTMHLVLSMPENTEPEAVREAVRLFAREQFGGQNQYVMALHHPGNDTRSTQPHVHLAIQCLRADGTRLNPRKADLQAWRESFADYMEQVGYPADATPRQARGVTKKAERAVIRHIERGDKTHPPRVPKVHAHQARQAVDELVGGAGGDPHPLDGAAKSRQQHARRAWLVAADALERGRPPLTFNGEEASNARPDYSRVRPIDIRAGLRAAALHQPAPDHLGLSTPAEPIPGLRDLSGGALVHHPRRAPMLLPRDASDRMGWQGGADPEMRRPGTIPSGAQERPGRLDALIPPRDEDRALAARIRAFVGTMPPIETSRDALKRQLRSQFAKTLTPEPAKTVDASAPVPSPTKDKDYER